MTELRKIQTASNVVFDDSLANLGENFAQPAIERLDSRLDEVKEGDRYYPKPILGVFESDFPTNPGDRYINAASPSEIVVVGESPEPLPNGAIISVLGKNYGFRNVSGELKFSSRIRLEATSIFYVASDGGGGVDKLGGGGVESPYQTLQFALNDVARLYDGNLQKIIIELALGTHTVTQTINIPEILIQDVFNGNLIIRGENADLTIINATTTRTLFGLKTVNARLSLVNFKIVGNNTKTVIEIRDSSYAEIQGIRVEGSFRRVFTISTCGSCSIRNIFVSGDLAAENFILLGSLGKLDLDQKIYLQSGTTASFSDAFYRGNPSSVTYVNSRSGGFDEQGTVIGRKFALAPGAVVEFSEPNAKNLDFFPGDLPGVFNSDNFIFAPDFSNNLETITGTRLFYIDGLNGSDLTGDGSVYAPFETLNYALLWASERFALKNAKLIFVLVSGVHNVGNIRFAVFHVIGQQFSEIRIRGQSDLSAVIVPSTDSGTLFQMVFNNYRVFFEDLLIDGTSEGRGQNQNIFLGSASPFVAFVGKIKVTGNFRYIFAGTDQAGLLSDDTTEITLENINCTAPFVAIKAGLNFRRFAKLILLGNNIWEQFCEALAISLIQFPFDPTKWDNQAVNQGKRFKLFSNGEINFDGADFDIVVPLDFLPGDAPGELYPGSIYHYNVQTNVKTFQSAPVSYFDGSTLLFPHGWTDFDPNLYYCQVQVKAVCLVSEGGWQVGEKPVITSLATPAIDSTNITVTLARNGSQITSKLSNKDWQILTPANWQIFVTAEAKYR